MRWLLQEHGLTQYAFGDEAMAKGDRLRSEETGGILIYYIEPEYRRRYNFDPDRATGHEVIRAVEAGPRPFRVTDLPRELRDRIYELVVVRTAESPSSYDSQTNEWSGDDGRVLLNTCVDRGSRTQRITIAPMPSILHTNRQMRREASKVFYQQNHFEWKPERPSDPQLKYNARRIPFVSSSRCTQWRALRRWTESLSEGVRKDLRKLTIGIHIEGLGWQYVHISSEPRHGVRAMLSTTLGKAGDNSAKVKLGRAQVARLRDFVEQRKKEKNWGSRTVIDYVAVDNFSILSVLDNEYWSR